VSINSSLNKKGSVNKSNEDPEDSTRAADIALQAAGLAHDLNNVLATISGYAEMIREDLPAGSPLKDDANHIISGIFRARLLTEEILTLGKYSARGDKENDVAAILMETIDFLTSVLPDNIIIEKDIPVIPVLIRCQPVKLFRIFLNIIRNAIQSMENRGGKLSAGLYLPSNEQLDNMLYNIKNRKEGIKNMLYNISEKRRYAVIYFRDTGPGIDKSVIERIYDPYFTKRNKQGGTGLGLAVVRNIVTELNGDIIVTSRPGEGTGFEILLPLVS